MTLTKDSAHTRNSHVRPKPELSKLLKLKTMQTPSFYTELQSTSPLLLERENEKEYERENSNKNLTMFCVTHRARTNINLVEVEQRQILTQYMKGLSHGSWYQPQARGNYESLE